MKQESVRLARTEKIVKTLYYTVAVREYVLKSFSCQVLIKLKKNQCQFQKGLACTFDSAGYGLVR